MADAQAEGNSPGPGGAEAGGTLRPVERQARKPPSADALGMARHPHAHRSPALDRSRAGHDATGQPVPSITIDDRGRARGTSRCGGFVDLGSRRPKPRELLAQKAREREATRIEGLVGRLVSAEPNQLPDIVKELDANPEVASNYLSPLLAVNAATVNEKRAQLHARLALVSRDRALVEPLLEELLTNKVVYVGPIRQQLRPYARQLTEKLRTILRDRKAEPNRRFRAAVALVDYVRESEAASWTEQDLKFVAKQLVSSNTEFQPLLRDALRPIGARLLGDLERIFADAKATDAEQLSAANAFADYAAGDIPKLSQLLAVATPEQFAVLYPIVAASPAPATIEDLAGIAARLPSVEVGSEQRIPYGQRRANAAVTLAAPGRAREGAVGF